MDFGDVEFQEAVEAERAKVQRPRTAEDKASRIQKLQIRHAGRYREAHFLGGLRVRYKKWLAELWPMEMRVVFVL